jgi:hypothetical protein
MPDLAEISRKFAQLADSLLLGRVRSPEALTGASGTHSLAAWQAYEQGLAARATWDLPGARQAFRTAVGIDPAYPHANLWLAQVMEWAGDGSAAWRSFAAVARRGTGRREIHCG